MSNTAEIPDFVRAKYGGTRQFKAAKRTAARKIRDAISELRAGCAYTPAYSEIQQLASLAEKIIRELSIAEWGR